MYPAGLPTVAARQVVTASGLRVRVAQCGDSHAAPLLMLHGWGCSLYAFRFLFEPLAAIGYRAVASDLKGHGLSDKPLGAGEYSLEAMTAHAFEIADALGIDDFEVIGHSMGGRIAVEMALRCPARVRRLWLINPVGFGPMPHVMMALPFARAAIARRLPSPLPTAVVRIPVAAVYGGVGTCTERDVQEYRAPTQFREFILASAQLLRQFDWSVMDVARVAPLRDRSSIVVGALDRVVQIVKSGSFKGFEHDGWRIRTVSRVAHVVHEEAPGEVMAMVRGESS
jgi:pimeloyl-ACP methyl ester carboxylesterase